MCWPVGSNRAAKTSPVWPVSSMTGDCSALLPEPYVAYQHFEFSDRGLQDSTRVTYRLYKRAILAGAVRDSDGRACTKIRVRLGALHQLARAEGVFCGSLFARHGCCGRNPKSRLKAWWCGKSLKLW
jgi:hypothetical protein